MRSVLTFVIFLAIIGGLGAGGYYAYSKSTVAPERSYKTAPVKQGGLVATITATGTVEPEELVDIGAQVAGRITSFGTDKAGKQVDYGSFVEAGMVLAQIDPTLYETDMATAKAQLEIDTAGVAKAKADADSSRAKLAQYKSDLEQLKAKLDQSTTDLDMFKARQDQNKSEVEGAQAKLDQAQRDWDRAQKIGPSEALSQESYDTYRGVFESARAAVATAKTVAMQAQFSSASQTSVIAQAKAGINSQYSLIAQAETNIASAEAAIKQAEGLVARDMATIQRATLNLNYCTIKSPVNGVIIDRRVNIGQTVVASLSAPSLFLLAKDLTHMQIWASMNEADIGNIHPGQPVTFTVDAFPNSTFKGSVRKVRLNATMTQNVVTYTIEVETDNSNGKLLPYLTANTQFEIARREDALMVPNAALRFVASKDETSPDAEEEPEPPKRGGDKAGSESGGAKTESTTPAKSESSDKPRERGAGGGKGGGSGRSSRGRVWVQDGKFLKPIRVKTGITDGVNTEVISEELKEGMPVVIGRQMAGGPESAGGTTNPFAPANPFGRSRNKPSTDQPTPAK